jgi:hypothetical protein
MGACVRSIDPSTNVAALALSLGPRQVARDLQLH